MTASAFPNYAGYRFLLNLRVVNEVLAARVPPGGTLDGPIIVLFEQHGAYESGDGRSLGKIPMMSLRRLISWFSRLVGLVSGTPVPTWAFSRRHGSRLQQLAYSDWGAFAVQTHWTIQGRCHSSGSRTPQTMAISQRRRAV
jgi:hypothetical protein